MKSPVKKILHKLYSELNEILDRKWFYKNSMISKWLFSLSQTRPPTQRANLKTSYCIFSYQEGRCGVLYLQNTTDQHYWPTLHTTWSSYHSPLTDYHRAPIIAFQERENNKSGWMKKTWTLIKIFWKSYNFDQVAA